MTTPDVTIVMSPREGFRFTQRAIESLFSDQRIPFDFICIDGGSPRSVKNYLRREALRRGFKLIRTPHYLTPNEARNLAFDEVKTRYVVFIDNDVVFTPGWLEHLVRCAEETDAAIVSPLVCIGEPAHTKIHMAGGDASVIVKDGRKIFHETHNFINRPVAEVRDRLVRQQTELAEFHCMLVRTQWLKRVGRFDEKLKAVFDHTDFCMLIRQKGGTVMIEPKAVITYIYAPPVAWNELAFFICRWSDQWTLDTERHFHEKWGTVFDDRILRGFVRPHRRYALPRLRRLAQVLVGWRRSEWLLRQVEKIFCRLAERGRAAALGTAAKGEMIEFQRHYT